MKKIPLLLALFVLFASAPIAFAQTTATTPASDEPMLCTMQYDPVCGKTSDGTIKTFGNSCTLSAEKAQFLYNGECKANAVTIPANDLWIGMRSADVTLLQNYLITKATGSAAKALQDAGATGYFGSLTQAALAEYQSAHAITPAQGYFGPKTRAAMNSDTNPLASTFTGKISAVSTACFADGICSVTVGDKKIVLLAGMRMGDIPPVGTIKGVDSIGDLENEIGSTAEVYAALTTKSDGDYTLYGSTSYYVNVLGK